MRHRNYLNFLLCILLILVYIFCAAGCQNVGDITDEPINENLIDDITDISPEAEYTQYPLVVARQSQYTIVIPANYSSLEMFAANEINTILNLACDCILDIKYDSQVTFDENSKYIILGRTKFLSDLDIEVPASLGKQGFIIKNVGKSIVISGINSLGYGTLNGAYEFLEYQVGFSCFAEDEVYVRKSESINLVKLDIAKKPDLENFIGSSGVYSNNTTLRRRMRIMDRIEVLGNGSITPYHNSFVYLPKATYQAAHSGWYSDKGTQICYAAHGNKDEYELMVETVFEKMLNQVLMYDLDIVTFTMEDEPTPCSCSACQEAKRYYGADSGAVVKFCNDLSLKFKEYFKENDLDRSVWVLFFAYYCFTEAPDSTKIICDNNVYPIIAPITEMDRALSIYAENNRSIFNTINNWKKVASRCGLWVYSANFGNYFVPFDPFTCMQENYQFFKTLNTMYIFDQGQAKLTGNSTCFNLFKCWLNAKLAWDTEANVDTLTKAYFKNYFKDAAEPMYRYYTQYRLHLNKLNEQYGYSHNNNDCVNQKYFPLGTVMSWKKTIDEAYLSIKPLQEVDVEMYNKLYKRICIESVSVNYLIIKLYGSYYSGEELAKMKVAFFEDCKIADITKFAESGLLENVFN